MKHSVRGLIVLTALLAAAVGGVSLERALFDQTQPLAATEPSPCVAGNRSCETALDAPLALDPPWETDAEGMHVSYEEPAAADASTSPSDLPADRAHVRMAPNVRLYNGEQECPLEPRVCQYKTRCARRLFWHRWR